ncbi:MAG: molecular chaperone [Planctomycetaceae bacterium]|nr:molecular chaperone [Planctomycetaceae bacterium]
MTGTLKRRDDTSPQHWYERGPLGALRHEMDDLFENFFGDVGFPQGRGEMIPSLDISETETAVEVTTDLPGLKPEEIDVSVQDGYLSISGEHSEETTSETGEDKKFHRVERRKGSFSRSVKLPVPVEEDDIEAQLHDGVLTVTLPKSKTARTRKVKIKG